MKQKHENKLLKVALKNIEIIQIDPDTRNDPPLLTALVALNAAINEQESVKFSLIDLLE